MIAARLPQNESERLAALREYGILDTESEALFDDICAIAARIFDVPVALVSFVDENRQWFKARIGIDAPETPRDISFCAHAVADDSVLVVPDARSDVRFLDNPLVCGPSKVRFYAGAPIRTHDGFVLGTVCVLDRQPKEVTDSDIALLQGLARQVQAHLTLRLEIVRRKKLEAIKDEFVSTVSHELRTPLTSIRGALGLVVGGALGELPDKFASMLEIAATNADRLVRLINDILDVEKMEAGRIELRLETVVLADIVQDAIDASTPFALRFGVAIDFAPPSGSHRVRVDRDRLLQVLDNLLSNAAKYSPRGGTVRVEIERVEHGFKTSIIDAGEGIPESFRNRVFQRFAQADSSDTRSRGGTGLGLAIAREIVTQHRGTIDFEPEPGGGTRFFFVLPDAADASSSVDVPPRARRVLVVEDDPGVARLLEKLLRNEGYDVSLAPDAETGLEAVAVQEFDAVTLDLNLPGQDGLSFIRSLRGIPSAEHLPVVVVSADADHGKEALEAGGDAVADWLRKPLDTARLIQALDRATSGSDGGDRLPRILHVEDDADLSRVIAASLQGRARLHRAESLAHARSLIASHRFDLTILDLALPDGNGGELFADMQALGVTAPVIIFAADEPHPAIGNRAAKTLIKSRQSERDLVATVLQLLPATRAH